MPLIIIFIGEIKKWVQWIGKCVEWTAAAKFQVQLQQFPVRTEENHKNPSEYLLSNQDWSYLPPKYKQEAKLLHSTCLVTKKWEHISEMDSVQNIGQFFHFTNHTHTTQQHTYRRWNSDKPHNITITSARSQMENRSLLTISTVWVSSIS